MSDLIQLLKAIPAVLALMVTPEKALIVVALAAVLGILWVGVRLRGDVRAWLEEERAARALSEKRLSFCMSCMNELMNLHGAKHPEDQRVFLRIFQEHECDGKKKEG